MWLDLKEWKEEREFEKARVVPWPGTTGILGLDRLPNPNRFP
jgi:hypothetical protein